MPRAPATASVVDVSSKIEKFDALPPPGVDGQFALVGDGRLQPLRSFCVVPIHVAVK
jgi:hypothetical protein